MPKHHNHWPPLPYKLMDRLHNQVFMPERVTHLQIYLEKVIVGVPRKMVMNKPKVFDLEKFKQLGLQFTMLVKSYNTSSHELCLVFDLEGPNVLNVPMVLWEFLNYGGVMLHRRHPLHLPTLQCLENIIGTNNMVQNAKVSLL